MKEDMIKEMIGEWRRNRRKKWKVWSKKRDTATGVKSRILERE